MTVRYRKPGSGDCIGVIALSSACHPDRFKAGIECLEGYGFRSKIALDPVKHYGGKEHLFSSDAVEPRARALEGLFADPDVRAIVAVRGAYGCVELLPEIDFSILEKNPKPLIGFSDTTAILNAIHGKTGLVAIHGPSIEAAFAKAATDSNARLSCDRLVAYLKAESRNPLAGSPLVQVSGKREGAGRLVGGNLTVLVSLLGTPWEPAFDDRILFIEDYGEKPYRLHRMLQQLKLAGKLDRLQGMILGSFRECAHPQGLGPTSDEVIAAITGDFDFPVIAGARFGHENPNFPMPIGISVRISANTVEFAEDLFE